MGSGPRDGNEDSAGQRPSYTDLVGGAWDVISEQFSFLRGRRRGVPSVTCATPTSSTPIFTAASAEQVCSLRCSRIDRESHWKVLE